MIADVRMPVMDGIELVREIQKRKLDVPNHSHLRSRRRANGRAGLKAGAQDFIEKPSTTLSLSPPSTAPSLASSSGRPPRRRRARREQRFERLTPREMECSISSRAGHDQPGDRQQAGDLRPHG